MDSLMNAVAPRSPVPVKKPPEVDFRSGAALDQLSSQVSELVLLEQGDFGDQTALEVHTAKDFIFNMLGVFLDVMPRLSSGASFNSRDSNELLRQLPPPAPRCSTGPNHVFYRLFLVKSPQFVFLLHR